MIAHVKKMKAAEEAANEAAERDHSSNDALIAQVEKSKEAEIAQDDKMRASQFSKRPAAAPVGTIFHKGWVKNLFSAGSYGSIGGATARSIESRIRSSLATQRRREEQRRGLEAEWMRGQMQRRVA